jgi:hypothetical protein
MLTPDELLALESLLVRARASAGIARAAGDDAINVGDLVQLRPGADAHWQTSILLVGKLRENGNVSGVVLRPHRSGYREAWYTYTRPEVIRVGRAPFPGPERAVRNASYLAECPKCLGRE